MELDEILRKWFMPAIVDDEFAKDEFCYTNPKSRFNFSKAILAELGGIDEEEKFSRVDIQ